MKRQRKAQIINEFTIELHAPHKAGELNCIQTLDRNAIAKASGGITISAPTTGWLGVGFGSSDIKVSR